ncbi:cyclic nucleotide-binding domain-containing protein [Arvimicrobium flavum]|uniref:cyclic nucleotide-binding domain-containing protein n=1 Tax=Arvimicrobium flavum TaxID=3393320 RepID=UPI00237A5F7F|nr:cyclic nucleotide-binding domain-containing protein [Mesorhizobium shangrilense]
MALDDDVRILSGVRLFQGFSPEQLRLLAFGAEALHPAAGRMLYHEGAEADSAFVVVSGQIGLYRERDGERVEMGVATAGALLGELALIASTHWLTSAEVRTEATLMRLRRKHFRRMLEEYPDLAALLHTRIAEDLQEMVRRIEGLSPRIGR